MTKKVVLMLAIAQTHPMLKLDRGKELIFQIISILSGMVELVETNSEFRLLGHSRLNSRSIPSRSCVQVDKRICTMTRQF